MEALQTWNLNRSGRFLHAVGRVRVRGRWLIGRRQFESMAEAEGVQAAWEVVQESGPWWAGRGLSAPADAPAAALEEIEKHLTARLGDALREAAGMMPGSFVPRAFAVRWDFWELKRLVREAVLDHDADADWVERLDDRVDCLLDDHLPAEYRAALRRLDAGLALDRTAMTVDRLLDGEMFDIVFERMAGDPSPYARAYFSRRADLLNLEIVLRGMERGGGREDIRPWLVRGGSVPRSVFLEALGGSGESFEALFAGTALGGLAEGLAVEDGRADRSRRLERLADDHLTGLLHLARYLTFGPEPLIGYLHGVEMEVKNLRRVFTGLAYREAPEAILPDLRRVDA